MFFPVREAGAVMRCQKDVFQQGSTSGCLSPCHCAPPLWNVKGKTLLITLLLKDQQPGEMYFVTFSLWSLFFRNENGDIHSGLHASAWRWVFNESLLPFPWALTEGHSRSCLWSILIATGDADPATGRGHLGSTSGFLWFGSNPSCVTFESYCWSQRGCEM